MTFLEGIATAEPVKEILDRYSAENPDSLLKFSRYRSTSGKAVIISLWRDKEKLKNFYYSSAHQEIREAFGVPRGPGNGISNYNELPAYLPLVVVNTMSPEGGIEINTVLGDSHTFDLIDSYVSNVLSE